MFCLSIDPTTQLRLLEERDAGELFALTNRNREYLRQWLPWLNSINSVEDTLAFIRSSLAQFSANNGFQAGIWHEGNPVGVIGYHGIDWANRVTSIGYWIGYEFQGRGIATKACRALVDHAFKELKLNRVEVACATENKKSQGIPERLGFKQEGVARDAEWLYDHYVDHILYATLAKDWASKGDG